MIHTPVKPPVGSTRPLRTVDTNVAEKVFFPRAVPGRCRADDPQKIGVWWLVGTPALLVVLHDYPLYYKNPLALFAFPFSL